MNSNNDPTVDPYCPPLSGVQYKSAVENQILSYPQVVRTKVDEPITGQTHGLVSFMLLKEPRQTKEGQRILGFFKLRGNWADQQQCTSRGANIVREQDSKHKMRVCNVGHWLPICDDDSMAKQIVGVSLDDVEKTRKLAEEQTDEKKRQVMREMQEREEEVKNAKDLNEDPTSLDYYTMKMVAWMRVAEHMDQFQKKADDLKEKREEVRNILRGLDEKNPSYNEQWVDNYNKERRKSGFPDYIPSSKDVEEYENTANESKVIKDRIEYHRKKIEELEAEAMKPVDLGN